MRRWRAALAAVGVSSAAALTLPSAAGAPDAKMVVATVGTVTITADELSRRMNAMPPAQLATFGKTPAEVRRQFLDRVLVVEALYAEEAKRRKLSDTAAVRDRRRDILNQALEIQFRDELARSGGVGESEIQSYFAANRARFETPRRIRLWRIVVKDEALARRIIEQSSGTMGVKAWSQLARDHSEDKATHMRDGDLGFVREDGTTDVPQVHADKALFAAADKVKDGELVPEPLKEGQHWAVVWRRGSMPAVSRTLEDERDAIRRVLERQKLERTVSELLGKLHERTRQETHDELLEYVTVSPFGDVAERERPGILPRRRARPDPEKGDRGYR